MNTHNCFRGSVLCWLLLAFTSTANAQRVYVNPDFPINGRETHGRSTLSPPFIAAVDSCSTHVYVSSFMPKATVRVFLNGTTLIGSDTPVFGFAAIKISQVLHAGDKLTATQSVNGLTSLPTMPAVIVGAMPGTLPMPSVDQHIYACGRVVPVENLLPGVTVAVRDSTAGSALIGNGYTPNDWGSQWDPVPTTALVTGHHIVATQAACTAPQSAPSPPEAVLASPVPMRVPVLDPPIVGNDAVTLHDLYTGASIDVQDHSSSVGSGWATGSDNWMHIPAIGSGALLSARQTLCSGSPWSVPQPPVKRIPAPQLLGPICPHQPTVSVRGTTINATLVLLNNGVVVGNGGAAPGDVTLAIAPPNAFALGDSVKVIEYIGSIVSPPSNVVSVNCAAQNVVTQHNDNARQGAQLAESALTPQSVSGGHFGLLYDRHVLGTLLAQPLYVHGVRVKGALKNVIYVATAEDVVYAFDADDQSADTTVSVPVRGDMVPESTKWLWRTTLGSPHVGDICQETVPGIVGITSTPVIDVPGSVMYVVARQQGDSPGMGHDVLHALDIATGADVRSRQVSATAAGTGLVFNDACQRQRPGLLLQNGVVYLGYGTFSCDAGCPNGEPYRGWIIGYRAADFAPAGAFTNSMHADEGGMGVWASGNGLAGSNDGSVFYETGNDIASSLAALGDSFVKLHGDGTSLTLVSHYQPPFASNYMAGDTDLGSGGPMLLPGGKLIGGGKDGQFFVLSQVDLSDSPTSFQAFYNTFHFGPGSYPYNSPTTYTTKCPPNGVYGVANEGQPCYIEVSDYKNGESFGPNIHAGPVFWQTSDKHGFVYKMAEKDYLKAFDYDLGATTVSSTPALVANVRPAKDGMPGGFSSISANGRRSGIVWTVVQQDNSMWGYPKPAILYAHDAQTLRELWNNNADRVVLAKFNSPTIADGRVVLPSLGLFQVYGLSPRPRASIRWLTALQAIERRWMNMGGAQGLLGVPHGEAHPEANAGVRRDYSSMVSGGGYGQISVPPDVKISAPMCGVGVKGAPPERVESSLLSSPRTGVHFIMGEIRETYLRAGGARRFGYPTTDEVPTPDGFGLMTRFEHGTIYWYPGRNAEIGEPRTPPLHVTPMK